MSNLILLRTRCCNVTIAISIFNYREVNCYLFNPDRRMNPIESKTGLSNGTGLNPKNYDCRTNRDWNRKIRIRTEKSGRRTNSDWIEKLGLKPKVWIKRTMAFISIRIWIGLDQALSTNQDRRRPYRYSGAVYGNNKIVPVKSNLVWHCIINFSFEKRLPSGNMIF